MSDVTRPTDSPKAREMADNPRVAATFYWEELGRQVRIQGRVQALSAEASDRYFAGRPERSQLGAWASEQSETLESPEALRAAFVACERRYEGRDVPRPEHWSGLVVVPERIEFWEARPHRLHQRLLFEKRGDEWTQSWLFP